MHPVGNPTYWVPPFLQPAKKSFAGMFVETLQDPLSSFSIFNRIIFRPAHLCDRQRLSYSALIFIGRTLAALGVELATAADLVNWGLMTVTICPVKENGVLNHICNLTSTAGMAVFAALIPFGVIPKVHQTRFFSCFQVGRERQLLENNNLARFAESVQSKDYYGLEKDLLEAVESHEDREPFIHAIFQREASLQKDVDPLDKEDILRFQYSLSMVLETACRQLNENNVLALLAHNVDPLVVPSIHSLPSTLLAKFLVEGFFYLPDLSEQRKIRIKAVARHLIFAGSVPPTEQEIAELTQTLESLKKASSNDEMKNLVQQMQAEISQKIMKGGTTAKVNVFLISLLNAIGYDLGIERKRQVRRLPLRRLPIEEVKTLKEIHPDLLKYQEEAEAWRKSILLPQTEAIWKDKGIDGAPFSDLIAQYWTPQPSEVPRYCVISPLVIACQELNENRVLALLAHNADPCASLKDHHSLPTTVMSHLLIAAGESSKDEASLSQEDKMTRMKAIARHLIFAGSLPPTEQEMAELEHLVRDFNKINDSAGMLALVKKGRADLLHKAKDGATSSNPFLTVLLAKIDMLLNQSNPPPEKDIVASVKNALMVVKTLRQMVPSFLEYQNEAGVWRKSILPNAMKEVWPDSNVAIKSPDNAKTYQLSELIAAYWTPHPSQIPQARRALAAPPANVEKDDERKTDDERATGPIVVSTRAQAARAAIDGNDAGEKGDVKITISGWE